MEPLLHCDYIRAVSVTHNLQRQKTTNQTERIWKERSIPNLMCYLGICLEKPSKASVTVVNLKFGPPEYEAGVLHIFYNDEAIY
jgi:hypothetical protein